MKPLGRWAEQGHWMRELREQCGLNRSDVEYRTDQIARRRDNHGFHVSRAYLRDIELGNCLPGFYKLEALASLYRRSPKELLKRYGVEVEEREGLFSPFPPSSGPGPNPVSADEEERRVLLSVASGFRSEKTLLLTEAEDALVIPAKWRESLGGKSVRFAVIGTKDDRMGELLPAGSLVAIDIDQKTIEEAPTWRTEADRPIYLVWQDDASPHVCRWVYQVGSTLTLLPYQATRDREVMQLKTPKHALIIGRVIHVWRLPRADVPQAGAAPDGPKKADAS